MDTSAPNRITRLLHSLCREWLDEPRPVHAEYTFQQIAGVILAADALGLTAALAPIYHLNAVMEEAAASVGVDLPPAGTSETEHAR